MAFNEADSDLRGLLSDATDEELKPLAAFFLREDPTWHDCLKANVMVKQYPKEPSRWWRALGEAIQIAAASLNKADSLDNAPRDPWRPWMLIRFLFQSAIPARPLCYHAFLCGLTKKAGMAIEQNQPTKLLEIALVCHFFGTKWEEDATYREALVKRMGDARLTVSLDAPQAQKAAQQILLTNGVAACRLVDCLAQKYCPYYVYVLYEFPQSPMRLLGNNLLYLALLLIQLRQRKRCREQGVALEPNL